MKRCKNGHRMQYSGNNLNIMKIREKRKNSLTDAKNLQNQKINVLWKMHLNTERPIQKKVILIFTFY